MSAPRRTPGPLVLAAMIGGVLLLLARPRSVEGLLGAALAVGLIGVLGPAPSGQGEPSGWRRWPLATGLGAAAFAVARAFHPPAPGPMALPVLGLGMLAGAAEEAFFRRLLYGWLAEGGAAVGITGSAAVFAAIHIPAYGLPALPLDFAAGLLFGWQRWATGGWTSPAVTHVLANVLQMM